MYEQSTPGGSAGEIILNNPATKIVAVMRSEEAANDLKQAAEELENTQLEVIIGYCIRRTWPCNQRVYKI